MVASVDGNTVTGTVKAPGQTFVMAGKLDESGGFSGAFDNWGQYKVSRRILYTVPNYALSPIMHL